MVTTLVLTPDSELESVLRDRVASGLNVGIVAGTFDPDMGIRFAACGDPGAGRPALGQDNVFELGSVGKVFTGVLLAEMAERGEVKLDDPVSQYLPNRVKVPSWGDRQITLVDLATHTSALPRLPTNLRSSVPSNPLADYTVDLLYEFLAGYCLTREIGSDYEYSNLGFGLLGHALAVRAGMAFEDLVTDRILRPLGMSMTAIRATPLMAEHAVLPHDEDGEVVSSWENPALPGCGGLRSNLTDMLIFAIANLGSGFDPLHRAMADSQQARFTMAPNRSIGLGWHTIRPLDRDIVWHNGETSGSRAFIGLDVDRYGAVVVLSNSAWSVDDIGYHLLDGRVPLGPPDPGRSVSIAPQLLDSYVGVYQLGPAATITVRRSRTGLIGEATGQGIARLWPESQTQFFVKQVGARITFQRDPAGAVTGLLLEERGKRYPAKKTG